MAVGTVRARIGGDLFDVARTGGVRHAPEPPPAAGYGLPAEAAVRPEDVLAEHRSGDAVVILAPPEADPDPAADPEAGDLFGAPAGGRRGGFGGKGGSTPPRSHGQGPGAGARRAVPAPAPRPHAPGPATDRQLGFAGDISKALRIPMPEGRDVETISGFIALHRNRLKGNRGRP